MKALTIYEILRQNAIPLANHYSDLYFPVTPLSTAIVELFYAKPSACVGVFRSQDEQLMYDVAFAFDPYWDARAAR